jgi:hypothetical protein
MRHSLDEIAHPSVREGLRYLKIDRGVEIHHDGDLPARSGMGTSSSFTVGLLHALYALKGFMPSKHQLAEESIHIEQEVLKETVGSQDQISAAYGGFNHISFLPNGNFSVRPITLTQERLKELNSHLMLFYTGIQRTSSNIAESYVNDMEARCRQLRIRRPHQSGISILNNGTIQWLGSFLRLAGQRAQRFVSISWMVYDRLPAGARRKRRRRRGRVHAPLCPPFPSEGNQGEAQHPDPCAFQDRILGKPDHLLRFGRGLFAGGRRPSSTLDPVLSRDVSLAGGLRRIP